MVLGKLPVPGRPTILDYSRARAYYTCSRCGWGLFGHFYSHLSFSPLSPSLWETARYRLKYCLKGPLNPKQPTNQPNVNLRIFFDVKKKSSDLQHMDLPSTENWVLHGFGRHVVRPWTVPNLSMADREFELWTGSNMGSD